MAVTRIEWQCPGCEKKYAIPDQNPRPKLCPACQKARSRPAPSTLPPPGAAREMEAETGKTRGLAPPARQPSFVEPEPVLEDEEEVEFEAGPVLPSPHAAHRPVKRRRYEELGVLSVVLKILAGLIGVITLVLVVEFGINVTEVPAGALRRLAVYHCFSVLVGGTALALLVYAFSIVVLVLKDVEHNTRHE